MLHKTSPDLKAARSKGIWAAPTMSQEYKITALSSKLTRRYLNQLYFTPYHHYLYCLCVYVHVHTGARTEENLIFSSRFSENSRETICTCHSNSALNPSKFIFIDSFSLRSKL